MVWCTYFSESSIDRRHDKGVDFIGQPVQCQYFSNPNYIYDNFTVDDGLYLVTNGGILETNNKAKVPGFGDVWFDQKAITNIFSFRRWKTSTASHMIAKRRRHS